MTYKQRGGDKDKIENPRELWLIEKDNIDDNFRKNLDIPEWRQLYSHGNGDENIYYKDWENLVRVSESTPYEKWTKRLNSLQWPNRNFDGAELSLNLCESWKKLLQKKFGDEYEVSFDENNYKLTKWGKNYFIWESILIGDFLGKSNLNDKVEIIKFAVTTRENGVTEILKTDSNLLVNKSNIDNGVSYRNNQINNSNIDEFVRYYNDFVTQDKVYSAHIQYRPTLSFESAHIQQRPTLSFE